MSGDLHKAQILRLRMPGQTMASMNLQRSKIQRLHEQEDEDPDPRIYSTLLPTTTILGLKIKSQDEEAGIRSGQSSGRKERSTLELGKAGMGLEARASEEGRRGLMAANQSEEARIQDIWSIVNNSCHIPLMNWMK